MRVTTGRAGARGTDLDGAGVCEIVRRHLGWPGGGAGAAITGDWELYHDALGRIVDGDEAGAVAILAGRGPAAGTGGAGDPFAWRMGPGANIRLLAAWLRELLVLSARGHVYGAAHGVQLLASAERVAVDMLCAATRRPSLWPAAVRAFACAGEDWRDGVAEGLGDFVDHLADGLALAWAGVETPWPFATDWRAACGALDGRDAPAYRLAAEQAVAVLAPGHLATIVFGRHHDTGHLGVTLADRCAAVGLIPDSALARSLLVTLMADDANEQALGALCRTCTASLDGPAS